MSESKFYPDNTHLSYQVIKQSSSMAPTTRTQPMSHKSLTTPYVRQLTTKSSPSSTKLARFVAAQRLLNKACDQIVLLNRREVDLKIRYDRAKANQSRGARASTHNQLAVVSGVKVQYYHYAHQLADIVEQLQVELEAQVTDN